MSTTPLPQLNSFEPRFIVQGDTASWYLLLGNYPPPSWVLSYAMVGAAQGMVIDFTEAIPSPDGEQHFIDLAPITTIEWIPGLYKFQSYVTNNSTEDRVTIGWGDITIMADLAKADPTDPRSYSRQICDIIELAMKGRLPQGMEHYSIGGRAISKIPLMQLQELWREYKSYVQQEEQAEQVRKGLGNPSTRKVRFDKVSTTYPQFPYGPRW